MSMTLNEFIYKTNLSVFTFLFYFSAAELVVFLMFFKNFVNDATESYMRFVGLSLLIIALIAWTIRSYFKYKLLSL